VLLCQYKRVLFVSTARWPFWYKRPASARLLMDKRGTRPRIRQGRVALAVSLFRASSVVCQTGAQVEPCGRVYLCAREPVSECL